jgi:hypothetical protein
VAERLEVAPPVCRPPDTVWRPAGATARSRTAAALPPSPASTGSAWVKPPARKPRPGAAAAGGYERLDDDAPGRGSAWQTRRAVPSYRRYAGGHAGRRRIYPNVRGNNAMPCFDERTAVGISRLDAGSTANRFDKRSVTRTPTAAPHARRLRVPSVSSPRATPSVPASGADYGWDSNLLGGLHISGRQGEDDADDPTPLVAEAARAVALGVRTFVTVHPAARASRSLSRMAEAGGRRAPRCIPDPFRHLT